MRGGGYGGSDERANSASAAAAAGILASTGSATLAGCGSTKIEAVVSARLLSFPPDIEQLHIPIFPGCSQSTGASFAVIPGGGECRVFECIMPAGHMPPLQQSVSFDDKYAAHDAANIGAQSIIAPIKHIQAPKTLFEAMRKCRRRFICLR